MARMDDASKNNVGPPTAWVVNFDEALLHACSAEQRADLLAEATMLARAFAPEGEAEHLLAMARLLCSGERDDEMGRGHARRLAAALRHLARRGSPKTP
jgi:hypothetical protein